MRANEKRQSFLATDDSRNSAVIAVMVGAQEASMTQAATPAGVKNVVVLVHGGFVDGSGWEGCYKALKHDGYTVTIVAESDDLLGR
jgi:ribosomal protein S11